VVRCLKQLASSVQSSKMQKSLLLLASFVASAQSARRSTKAQQMREGVSEYVQMTASGCECTSPCSAGIGDQFRCDSCSTQRCGKFGIGTRYDFCVYPSQQSFESKTYTEKIDYYKSNLARDPNVRVEFQGALNAVAASASSSMHTTFDNFLPEMPATRQKAIHTIGGVCGVDFIVGSSPYTGLLSRGTHKGFVRLGSAIKPDESGIVPGVGFKFPRTGVPSGDLVVMHTTDGGQSHNFLANNMSNHVPPASGGQTVLARVFERATICATQVGLSDFARYTQGGSESSPPNFPFKLFFVPSADVQMTETLRDEKQMIDEFAKWPVGTKLFDVHACASPTDSENEVAASFANCAGRIDLGTIHLNSKCSASDYGDQALHIRHQRIEEDWQFKPEFKQVGQLACGRSSDDWNRGSPSRCEGAPKMLGSDA